MRVSNNLMKVLLVVYIWATSDTVSIHKTPYIQKNAYSDALSGKTLSRIIKNIKLSE